MALRSHQGLKAADLLAAEGISAEVIDCFSIKPFDVDTLLGSVEKTGCVVTAEDHMVAGGLHRSWPRRLPRIIPHP